MASSLIRVLLLCTTPVIIASNSAARSIGDVFGYKSAHQFIDVGLRFLEEPSDAVVAINRTVELYCRAQSSLNETVHINWFLNGKKIEDRNRTKANNEILVVTSRRKSSSEAGVYHCTANVTRGLSPAVLISRSARVKIARLSSISNRGSIISSVGKSIRLSCEFTSVPAATVTWIFQNRSLQIPNSRYDASIPGVLYISDVKLSDSGDYRCLVSNPYRKKPKVSTPLRVKIVSSASEIKAGQDLPPHKSSAAKKIAIVWGETLTLECSALDDGDVFVLWTFAPSLVEDDKKASEIARSKYFNVLKKTNVSLFDSGLYTCAVIRDDSVVRQISEFNVTVIVPPKFTVTPKSQNVTLAFRVNFECKAEGYPPPSIEWYRNGVPVEPNARVVIHSDGLKLIFASTQDFGMYQCIASNGYGAVSSSARLYMVDIANPSSPTNLSCFGENSTAVHLRWEQPNDRNHQPLVAFRVGNNGSAPDMAYVYVVVYHEANGKQLQEHIQPATSNSLVVDSLKPDTRYIFSVLSFQGKSGSDPSRSVACTTFPEDVMPSTSESISCSSVECNSFSEFPIASTKMSHLNLQSLNNSALLINWQMDTPTFKTERSFIMYRKLSNSESMKVPINYDEKKIILTNLEPGKLYEISLIIVWNATELTVDSKTIMMPHPLHLNVTNVTTNSFTLVWYSESKNVYYRVLYGEKAKRKLIPFLNASVSNFTIFDLKPSTDYIVEVQKYEKNNSFSFDSASVFARTLPFKNTQQLNAENVHFQLSNEQTLGIFIGLGIGCVFIMLCVLVIICAKRHIEKRHHRIPVVNRPSMFPNNEKHEMKIISTSSSKPYKGYINGRDGNVNQPVPLLSGTSSGYLNGYVQSYEFGNRRVFYDLESKTLREESDLLLNNSNLPSEDICLTIPEEQDHEGGDSGYCDRNQSLSPYSGYHEEAHRLRKFSDVKVDDGFYESEFQSFGKTTNSQRCELRL